MIDETEWSHIATVKPEPRRDENHKIVCHRPNKKLIDNIELMIIDHSRWKRIDVLVFQHDTGVVIQLRRPSQQGLAYGIIISKTIAVWTGDLPPFKITIDDKQIVLEFYQKMLLLDAQETIDTIGVIAALCK